MYIYNAEVVRVIDGDTIVCNIDLGFGLWKKDEHIRLAGINTPEVRTKDEEEKQKGLEAKAYVESTLTKVYQVGGKVQLKTIKDKGKFGRFIAEVFLINPDESKVACLNEMLLSNGHAEKIDY